MRPTRITICLLALGLLVGACTAADEPAGSPPDAEETAAPTTTVVADDERAAPDTTAQSYAGTIAAPEFPDGLDWLNTAAPLSLAELRGKVVLLDFWTYGCINCMHIIPDLERLEAEYAEELVVIGVHSAKFVNESETENIRQIILRYGLEHPVVNDKDFTVWRTWGATGWPTVVLIDPAGNVVGGRAGEGVYPVFQPIIESLVTEFDAKGLLDRTPFEAALERDGLPETVLSFPGKVLATDELLYIADSNHHRIVVADRATGDVVDVYGSGRRGLADGDARNAQFAQPQGMAITPDGATLYVADTENHAVRAIDLAGGQVTTVAGTGRQLLQLGGGPATATDLASPWDVELDGDRLYIAMAGIHQIWALDFPTGVVAPLVGSAAEGTTNEVLQLATLAQPSGLALAPDGRLYFADSESSSIRWAEARIPGGRTGTISGSDAGLFDFGDEDGTGTAARLQHPLGVAFAPDGTLYVADTYNSKIKTVDVDTGETVTFAGGEQGWADGTDPRFYEPGGLSVIGDTLYVADTNNHAIRMIDLRAGVTDTLVLRGIERFAPAAGDEDYRGQEIGLDQVTVAPGTGTLVLDIGLPEDHKVNEDAPSSVQWIVGENVAEVEAVRSLTGVKFPVEIPVEWNEGFGSITADMTVIYCREDAEDLCLIQQLRFTAPVTVADGGVSDVTFTYDIVLPEGA